MQILNVKTAKKYLQWVVCKKCSETAVGFVTQWKPVVFAVKILAVYRETTKNNSLLPLKWKGGQVEAQSHIFMNIKF